MRNSIAVALAVSFVAGVVQAQAQHRDVRGIVTDTAGRALSNVEVRIMDLGRVTRTDAAGRFLIDSIGSRNRVVDLTVRRLGYQVRFVRVSMVNGEGDFVRIAMIAEPVLLAKVEIEGPEERHPFFAEFERRKARGVGTFVTQAQIDKLHSSYASDVFRGIPGMRFVRVGSGQGVRFMSSTGMRGRGGECAPTIWVDGQAVPGMEIDDIRTGDIFGIEIYRGASTTPPQFAVNSMTHCGAIVVWTRRKLR